MLRLKDESIFEDAEAFKPERWLRNKDTALIEAVEAFASLPFGLTLRMCLGRRIAELELHLLMGRIVQQFDISYPPEAENVELFIRGVTISDTPIKLQFVRFHKGITIFTIFICHIRHLQMEKK